MATQVLKQYIDKVLGNSIRCLLPSYWWKRLFGMVVDEVDKVKNSISTLEDGYKALEESKADADAFIMLETTELDRMEYGAVYLVHGQQDSLKVNFWEYKSPSPDVLNWTIWFSNKTSLEVTANGSAFQWEGGTPTINLNNLNPNNLYRLDCTLVTVGASGATIKYKRRVARIVEYGNSDKYDTFVSETSTNAVQNKVITAALNNKVDKEELTNLQNEVIANEEVSAAAFNEINERIEQLSENVSGAAATKEELAEAVATLNGSIATKQDTLVSGTNIKTLNGESILGEGNIVLNVDTSSLATKEELESLTNEVITNEEVSAAAFNEINDRINAISENVSGTTVTKEEFESTVTTINESIATKQDTLVSGTSIKTINGVSVLGEGDIEINVDTSALATKEEVTTLINEVITNEEISAAALTDLDARIKEIIARLDVIEGNN